MSDILRHKYPRVNEPTPNVANLLGSGYVKIDGYLYPVFVTKVPSTASAIVNVTINDDNWNEIATGLTGVCEWRLSERTGNEFHYAYEAAPATYCTAFGILQRNTGVENIYVKRVSGAGSITIELECWVK